MDNPVLWFLLAVVVIGAGLAVVISLTRRSSDLNQDEFRSRWMQIQGVVAKDNPSSWQVAIMEADKLLDQALIKTGARGNTLGERLKSSAGKFGQLNAVWGVHKLRNRIAHEPDTQLTHSITVKSLEVFKRALKDLGAI